MKIVDAKPPKSKAQEWRETIPNIVDKEQAIFVERQSDASEISRIATKIGFKSKWRKSEKGGWLVWISSH